MKGRSNQPLNQLELEALSSEERKSITDVVTLLLTHPLFRKSEQCQDFLRHVVEKSVDGDEEALRERIIGVEVFGRRPDYDTAEDPIVRIRAADVRKRLAQFYHSPESEGAARIEIPLGSYMAHFDFRKRVQNSSASEVQTADFQSPSENETQIAPNVAIHGGFPRASKRRWLGILGVTVCVCSLLLYFLTLRTSRDDAALNMFWAPMLATKKQVTICIGTGAVYALSPSLSSRSRISHADMESGLQPEDVFVPFGENDRVAATDLIPRKNIYISVGAASAGMGVVSLLTRSNHNFDVRYGSDVVFGDLYRSPTVLIGGFNNPWTLEMTDNLRFVFGPNRSIIDRQNPAHHWSADPNFSHDYAIISRLLDSKTGGVLVTIGGVGQAGTRAGSDFITDSHAISTLLQNAPKGWEKKNLQIILETSVVNGAPADIKLLALHSW